MVKRAGFSLMALRLSGSDGRGARWVGTDALRELRSEAVRRRKRLA